MILLISWLKKCSESSVYIPQLENVYNKHVRLILSNGVCFSSSWEVRPGSSTKQIPWRSKGIQQSRHTKGLQSGLSSLSAVWILCDTLSGHMRFIKQHIPLCVCVSRPVTRAVSPRRVSFNTDQTQVVDWVESVTLSDVWEDSLNIWH